MKMRVFISWSGKKSGVAATLLKERLPDIIQNVDPWMSEHDIYAGVRWLEELRIALEEAQFGIICLTRSNLLAPWLHFEAGALAKGQAGNVCPYLIDLNPTDVPDGPFKQFEMKKATGPGTKDLLLGINRALKDEALPKERLERLFNNWWDDFWKELNQNLPKELPVITNPEMYQEILNRPSRYDLPASIEKTVVVAQGEAR